MREKIRTIKILAAFTALTGAAIPLASLAQMQNPPSIEVNFDALEKLKYKSTVAAEPIEDITEKPKAKHIEKVVAVPLPPASAEPEKVTIHEIESAPENKSGIFSGFRNKLPFFSSNNEKEPLQPAQEEASSPAQIIQPDRIPQEITTPPKQKKSAAKKEKSVAKVAKADKKLPKNLPARKSAEKKPQKELKVSKAKKEMPAPVPTLRPENIVQAKAEKTNKITLAKPEEKEEKITSKIAISDSPPQDIAAKLSEPAIKEEAKPEEQKPAEEGVNESEWQKFLSQAKKKAFGSSEPTVPPAPLEIAEVKEEPKQESAKPVEAPKIAIEAEARKPEQPAKEEKPLKEEKLEVLETAKLPENKATVLPNLVIAEKPKIEEKKPEPTPQEPARDVKTDKIEELPEEAEVVSTAPEKGWWDSIKEMVSSEPEKVAPAAETAEIQITKIDEMPEAVEPAAKKIVETPAAAPATQPAKPSSIEEEPKIEEEPEEEVAEVTVPQQDSSNEIEEIDEDQEEEEQTHDIIDHRVDNKLSDAIDSNIKTSEPPVPEPQEAPMQIASLPAPSQQVVAEINQTKPVIDEISKPVIVNPNVMLSIAFENNSVNITNVDKERIKTAVQKILDSQKHLKVVSYATGVDSDINSARRLSLQRAIAIRSYMIDSGLEKTRINVQAAGNNPTDKEFANSANIYVME